MSVKKLAKRIVSIATAATLSVGMIGVTPVSAQEGLDEDTLAFVDAMGAGWNLGNTFDAVGSWLSGTDTETAWQKYKTTQAMITAVHDAGFETIRIPVSWAQHVDTNYKVDSAYMARVKEVVDYAYNEGMFVILNIHHDNTYVYREFPNKANGMGFFPDNEHKESSTKYLKAVWSQISETFKDYDDSLIFETLNEPRLEGTYLEWNSPAWSSDSYLLESANVINYFNQEIVNTIRESGGENATRYIMCPGYGAQWSAPLHSSYVLPTDPISTNSHKIMVSTHAYEPYEFCLTTNTSAFDNAGKTKISDEIFKPLYEKFVKNGTAVVMGECGATFKNNQSDCDAWASYYFGVAEEYDIPAVLWDNNVRVNPDNPAECHQHLDRSNCTFVDPTFIEAIMDTIEQDVEPDPDPSERVPGDVDDDNDVDIDDVLLIQQHIAKWGVDINLENADVNGDGDVNIDDVLLIQQYIAGWGVKLV